MLTFNFLLFGSYPKLRNKKSKKGETQNFNSFTPIQELERS